MSQTTISEEGEPYQPDETEEVKTTLFRDLIDAVKGTEVDYTSGSVSRAILLLSVPMMLELVLESVFAVVDVIY